ncbi:gamma-glutamyltransferase family protein [Stenotrophomonas sp. MMGLT7]|uniref:gamma-glutamyltransferase family protein n=1 Tax=Stenotrophomonas sp. MMGLT7 TaxID=2901227 RepID=UPI001E539885|nr:gamma-glutamyltransferase family protein [Stenotrophomonas sp. MMGLT7]
MVNAATRPGAACAGITTMALLAALGAWAVLEPGLAQAQQNAAPPDFPEQVRSGAPAPERTMFPQVRTMKAMVAGGNNFVTEAGLRILRQGGNAVDAGVAAMLAGAVTEEDHFSMGGEAPILVKLQGRPVAVVSGIGTAPALATPQFYAGRPPLPWERADRRPPIPSQGILATTTPGMVDGALLALREYGRLSFAQVAQPAIELAEAFPVTEVLADTLKRDEGMLRRWPNSWSYFTGDSAGRLPVAGDIFRQPQLAATLRAMVQAERQAGGEREAAIDAVRDYFYRGPVARKMGEFSEANGGLVRYGDIAAFAAEIDTPRSTTFHGYEIVKPGFWTQGPVMLQMFNILEGYDLQAMGHNSPQYLHTLAEAAKLAFADRDTFYGDPKFAKVPERVLLSKAYAAQRRGLIDPDKAMLRSIPGRIRGYGGPLPDAGGTPLEVKDTTSLAVVDAQGNVFSATPSGAWLPSVKAGDTGISFGTRLQSFVVQAGHPNVLQKGKRPRVTLSPTLILKDGQPVYAVNTPGGDNQDQAMLQVILNMIVFGMTPQQAVEAPRFQTNALYASFGNHEYKPGDLSLESRIDAATAAALKARGHDVTVRGPWSNASAPSVIRLAGTHLEGGADPRRARFVDGY